MPTYQHNNAYTRWFRRLFGKGARPDIQPELLPDGEYTDALNMRPADITGNTGALKSVDGEVLLWDAPNYPNVDPTTYLCIGATTGNGYTLAFWASSEFDYDTDANPPILTANGTVVAMSRNIPYVFDRPLQIAPVLNCGERILVAFPADHHSDPLFWDVKAMLDALASGSQAYFSAYTIDINSVALNAPPSIVYPTSPDCIVDLGGAGGLPVGQYAYFVRYVDPNGNRTNWGPATGLIPVPFIYTPNNLNPPPNYPRTLGGVPNALVPSQYGISIEFRVNNPYGYTSIELGRQAFNNGDGIQGVGVKEIIARIPIAFGQSNIVSFLDPVDSNLNPHEVIPADEAVVQLISIKEPKAVDYSDGRLKYANYKTEPKNITLTFLTFAGKKMTAITKALRRLVGGVYIPDGYDNPYNCAVNKSAQRGGQAKYGIQFWDGAYGLYPAVNITEPFTPGTDIFPFPQRRDIKGVNGNWGADSATYSDDPCYAGTVDVANQTAEGPVGSTFEAFTGGTRPKTDTARVTNVQLQNGVVVGTSAGRPAIQFSQYAVGPLPPQVGVGVQPPNAPMVIPSDLGYQPWDPRNNQAQTPGFNVPPNTSRFMNAASSGGAYPYDPTEAGYDPHPAGFADQCFPFNPDNNLGACFDPTHHSLGVLIAGVDSGIPNGATIMSVVYNGDTSGEIVAQGFGSWNLQTALRPGNWDTNTISAYVAATKDSYGLRVFFPDQAGGITDQATWEDIQQNPGNYNVRFSSPLPFYPEIYGYWGYRANNDAGELWSGEAVVANMMDVMCHTSFLHDEGKVNVGVTNPEGYQPNPGIAPDGSWVGFDKWRRSLPMDGIPGNTNSYSFWQQQAAGTLPGEGGNALFDLAELTPVSSGRTNYFYLRTVQPIYPPASFSTQGFTDVNNEQVRNFQGPWYVLNIIRKGATIPDANIQPYKNMGCHIALRQQIGIYQGGQQDFRLIGEREQYDCTNYLPTDYRYTYIIDPVLGERRWICATGNTQINTAQILADIIAFGFWTAPDGLPVYGLYESFVDDTGKYIRYGGSFPGPVAGSKVILKYDKTAPIRAFGHDVTIAPVTHCVRDGYATTGSFNNGAIQSLEVLGGLPFIHAGFGLNPRWFLPATDGITMPSIYVNYMGTMRQWCIMWSAESRLLPSMYVNENSTDTTLNDTKQFFPAIHYVARPYLTDGSVPAGFFPQYQNDYPNEWSLYNYGGLRFMPGLNLDYARQPDVGFFGYPKVGIVYPNDFCTNIAASLPFNPAQADTPGYRTFLQANAITLSEESGEIKVIATASGGQVGGQNEYVWFQNGVGIVPTNKNILSGASGETVATYVTSNYWGNEYRISRTIGLPDQFWRLWSRGMLPNGAGDAFYWPNRNGYYTLVGDSIRDITRNEYLSKVRDVLVALPSGYIPHATAFYDTLHQEVWNSTYGIRVGLEEIPAALHVYSPQNGKWLGKYSYLFDEYTMTPDGILGMRALQTWRVDRAGQSTINGQTRENWVHLPAVGDVGKFKWPLRFRVTGSKPDYMNLYDENGVLMSDQSEAIQEAFQAGTGFLWVRKLHGWEGPWWHVRTAYDPARPYAQGMSFFVRVGWNTPDPKEITALDLQFQNMR